MPDKPTLCSNPGCDHEIGRKYVLCRPCAVAHVRGSRPYIEPCGQYVGEPVRHLHNWTCQECGYDSAEHPGSGRQAAELVRIAA